MRRHQPFFFNRATTPIEEEAHHSDHGVITYRWGQGYITKCTSGVWIGFNEPRKGDVRLERVLDVYIDHTTDTVQEKLTRMLIKGTTE